MKKLRVVAKVVVTGPQTIDGREFDVALASDSVKEVLQGVFYKGAQPDGSHAEITIVAASVIEEA